MANYQGIAESLHFLGQQMTLASSIAIDAAQMSRTVEQHEVSITALQNSGTGFQQGMARLQRSIDELGVTMRDAIAGLREDIVGLREDIVGLDARCERIEASMVMVRLPFTHGQQLIIVKDKICSR